MVYTGRLMESEMFGEFSKEKISKKEADKYSFDQAMDIVIKQQPDDPTNPSAEFAKDLRNTVARLMNLSENDKTNLKFYTAVNSHIDWKGVDAFFIYVNSQINKEHVVTIDGTANPDKDLNRGGAECLICPHENDLDKKFDKKRYEGFIYLHANEISRLMKKKILRNEVR